MNKIVPNISNDNLNININIISNNQININNNNYCLVDEKFLKNINLPFEKYKHHEIILFSNQNDILF